MTLKNDIAWQQIDVFVTTSQYMDSMMTVEDGSVWPSFEAVFLPRRK